MDPNVPRAQPDGVPLPVGQVPNPTVPQHLGVAPPAPGAVQPAAAPPPRRSRRPHGPVPPSSNSGLTGAPAILEISAAYPMFTDQRRSPNYFVPDAQMLFHVLSICDSMMNATDRFLRSSPAWLPIVSQLYISILWNVMILRVYVATGYGTGFAELLNDMMNTLQIGECMIPGPLVAFFQSLAAINGPFEWIGDILPAMPGFTAAWSGATFSAQSAVARMLPFPVIMLDQLYAFSQYAIPANQQSSYTTFQWYRSVFSQGLTHHDRRNRIGPQLCGSLYTTQPQYDAARNFWNAALTGSFTRVNADDIPFTTYLQLLGFVSQNGNIQTSWFQHVAIVMQKYAQYFNGSVPLKSVLPVGIGAPAVYGKPRPSTETRDWFYPTNAMIEPFTTGVFEPRREIPPNLKVFFSHADHELEEQAEQYAILTHTNMIWTPLIASQNDWEVVNPAVIRQGDYWNMPPFRFSPTISVKVQFAQLIASRYHQQAANRAE